MSYLIDTNIIVDYFRGFQPIIDGVNPLLANKERLAISVITVSEIYAGKSTLNNSIHRVIENILKYMDKILIDESVAKKAGKIKRDYQIDIIDALIAATAIKHRLILVTRNVKHFENIPGLKTLNPSQHY